MKLDNEQDRQVLLGLIQNSTIQGSTVFIIADLVKRIQEADINDAPTQTDRDAAQTPAGH